MSAKKINPASVSPADAAKILSRVGGQHISLDEINAAIAQGAPVNNDGNLNLIHLGAWLLKTLQSK